MSDNNMALRIPYATPLPDDPKKSDEPDKSEKPNPDKSISPPPPKEQPKRFIYVALKTSARLPNDTSPYNPAVLATSVTINESWRNEYPHFDFCTDIPGPNDEAMSVVIDSDENIDNEFLGWANSHAPAWALVEQAINDTKDRFTTKPFPEPRCGTVQAPGETEARFAWANFIDENDVTLWCDVVKLEPFKEFGLKEALQGHIMKKGVPRDAPSDTALHSEKIKEEGRGPWVRLETGHYFPYHHPVAKSMGTKATDGDEGEEAVVEEEEKKEEEVEEAWHEADADSGDDRWG
ncbi:hypothetical protein BDV96DRAFT_589800 [Lophiotrema nucula]|uniref:Uncharacterized protein n=1 Tax=Lophiotrema nucula TaxID=690887 RepID=A0A6A5YLS2_9PLEO|nr:hypothetical protein BDV96DRAFT_589800 [Lophiotrema nucula]